MMKMKSDGRKYQICIRMELLSGIVHSFGSHITTDREDRGKLALEDG
jgi:hypothetical protein